MVAVEVGRQRRGTVRGLNPVSNRNLEVVALVGGLSVQFKFHLNPFDDSWVMCVEELRVPCVIVSWTLMLSSRVSVSNVP